MRIAFDLKPKKFTASSKQALLTKIQGDIWTRDKFRLVIGSRGSFLVRREGHGSYDEGTARFYNLQKFNRKVKTTKRVITRGKRKGEVEVTTQVIRESHWLAHVYDLPMTFVKSGKQSERTFTLQVGI